MVLMVGSLGCLGNHVDNIGITLLIVVKVMGLLFLIVVVVVFLY